MKEFSQCFELVDPDMEACNAIEYLQQSKGQTVRKFAEKFENIRDQTEMSNIDLWELPEI